MLVKYRLGTEQAWRSFEHTWFGDTLDYAIVDLEYDDDCGDFDGLVTFVRYNRSWKSRQWYVNIEMREPTTGDGDVHKVLDLGISSLQGTDKFMFLSLTGTYKVGNCPVINVEEINVEDEETREITEQEDLLALPTEGPEAMMIAIEAIHRD